MSGNPNKIDARQAILKQALNMAGTSSGAGLDTILEAVDPEIAKLFEDRNIFLTDGGLITFTGSQLQFTENLNIVLNQKISGAVPQIISLGSSNQNFTNSGDMLIAVINRTAGTGTLSIVTNGSALAAVSSANQEVFLVAKRIDAGDGTQRLYWRNGTSMNAGQTLRLGQSSAGGGNGSGSDLPTLLFRAQFIEAFTEGPTSSVSAVQTTNFTNATYNAAKSMYAINYDASKTLTTTGTSATLSGTPAFTVAVGDVVINLATGEVKKITVVTTQTSWTIESAFTSNLVAQAVCVSQCVHTKDIYNYNYNGAAAALSAAFSGATFSEIMVDYEDNGTSGSNLWTPNTTPFVAYVGSTDNSNWMTLQLRSTNETDTMQSDICPTAGTSLYLRFFANKSSGNGTVNLISYEAFMQKFTGASSGNILWSAYGTTNSSTSAINCTLSVVGGKTQIAFTGGNQYAVGVNTNQAYGVLDVYVNGQILPRFVSGSVPTGDGYYTEISPTIIQLDKDYSSLALDFMVISRVQVIDTSTQNSSNIAVLNVNQLRNYLLNGAMDLWQRQTSQTIANGVSTYTADRWYVKNSLGTNGVITNSQVTGVLSGSKYGNQVQITTAPTAAQANGTELYQVIENPMSIDLINNPISFSAYVKALGNVNQVGLQFCYATSEVKPTLFFGTEQLVTVNTSGFALGQLVNQNSGNTPTTSGVIGVRIRITGVSSGNLYALNNGFVVEQACVNLGATAMAFGRAGKNFAEELAMCQRFYEKSFELSVSPAQNTGSDAGALNLSVGAAGNWSATNPYKVTKRTDPSVTTYNPRATNNNWWDYTNSTSRSQIGVTGAGQTGNSIAATLVATSTNGIHWTADAEI